MRYKILTTGAVCTCDGSRHSYQAPGEAQPAYAKCWCATMEACIKALWCATFAEANRARIERIYGGIKYETGI
jgi:hypothetical protein